MSFTGAIARQIPRLTSARRGGTVDLGDIKLERGSVVRGNARVEGEQKTTDLPPVSLQRGGADNTQHIRFWNGGHTFETEAMTPGSYLVVATDLSGNPSKDWQVVAPKTLRVPAPDAPAPAVEIVLKRLGASQPIIQEAHGRIVDAQGQSVAGAVIKAQFARGYSTSSAQVVTDAEGNWRAQTGMDATEFKVLGIERPGYVQVGQAQTALEGGTLMVTGLSLKRRGAPFAGRVVNADGRAAAGAWVAVLEARDYPPVRADEAGRFALPDLPLERFTLIAAQSANWARLETRTDAKDTEITLAPPAAFDRAKALDLALQGEVEWWNAEDYWGVLGAERMEELADHEGKNREWNLYRFALGLAEREPARFVERAPALMDGMSADQRAEVEAQLRWVQAGSADADAKIEANNWVDAQKAAKKAVDAASATQLLRAAAVAHRLGREDADALSDSGTIPTTRSSFCAWKPRALWLTPTSPPRSPLSRA